jgi:hypothetical protein
MLIVFAVNFLSAFWIFSRIWQDQSAELERYIGLITIPLSTIISPRHPIAALLLTHAATAAWPALAYWRTHLSQRQVIIHSRALIDLLILSMRAGKSFRLSLQNAAAELDDGLLATHLRPWVKSLQVTNPVVHRPSWWKNITLELTAIDKQSHQALLRLQRWRELLKLETQFRRRSGQIMVQIRLQAILVGALYCGLLVYSSNQGYWRESPGLLCISILLFLAGMGFILSLGRRVKWNF